MMQAYARLRGLRRLLLPVPLLTPHLSGLWLALVTPAQARVGRALVEGLKNSTVVRSPAARDAFRIDPMPLREALTEAIEDGAARAAEDRYADDRRRCAAGAGLRADPPHRRRHRLVFRYAALERAGPARPLVRRRRHGPRTPRPGALRRGRRHRRLDCRSVRARSPAAAVSRISNCPVEAGWNSRSHRSTPGGDR